MAKKAKTKKRRSIKKQTIGQQFNDNFKKIFFSSQGFPIMLTLSVIAVLFVLFRMKAVETNYKITSMNKDIDKVALESKELKAKKARLLSVKALNKMARKYELNQPKDKQIIVIP
jgi:cell division protein FtsL